LALLAVAPGVAQAGTVTRTVNPAFQGPTAVMNVTYVYRAGTREANRVRVQRVQSGGNGFVIRDSGGVVDPGSPDCLASGSSAATCLAPASLDGRRLGEVSVLVQTRGRDDRFRAGSGVSGTVDLGSGNDRGLAVDGAVTAFGRTGNDMLRSGRGADALHGGRGADLVVAGAGDDTLTGGGGNDRLLGGSGRDRIDDGGGSDRVLGGSGADRIVPTGTRRGIEGVSCGPGRDLVVEPDRFVNVGPDCELAESAAGDRLFARPLRVQDGALVFLAGCSKPGCRAASRAGAVLTVRLGVRPPGRGRRLGRKRYHVGLLGSREVRVRLSAAELRSLKAPGSTSLEVRAAGIAFRILIRVR
jgi:RTX calcium-binding nonapeptide repeat (4 copies)